MTGNDKASTRFFYNLGVESFKQMVNANGVNYVMAMIDSAGNEPTPTELDAQNQLTAEFGQMTFDGSDPDAYHGKGQNVRKSPELFTFSMHELNICEKTVNHFSFFSLLDSTRETMAFHRESRSRTISAALAAPVPTTLVHRCLASRERSKATTGQLRMLRLAPESRQKLTVIIRSMPATMMQRRSKIRR